MTHPLRRARVTVLGCAALAGVLAACSSSSSPSSAAKAAASGAGAATSAAASATGAVASAAATTGGAGSSPSSASSASSGSTGGPGCSAAKGKTVGYSEPIPDPNFASIEKIMRKELDKYGVTLKTTNANLNPGKQLSDIRTLLQSGIGVLVVNPLAPQAIRPALDEVRAKKVPIVAQESKQGGPFYTNVTADVETAVSQATALIKSTGKGGKVAAVTAPPLAEILTRENGAFDKGAAAAGLTVVARQVNTMISPQGARAIADSYKQKYGSGLTAIWTFNDTSATGIASAFGGSFTPALYSLNGQPEAIPFVRSGAITATWDLRQDKLGQALAYSALSALCGATVPSEIVIPLAEVDKANVGSYRPLSARVNDPFDLQFEQRAGRTYVKVTS